MTADDKEVGTGINLFAAGAVRGVARWFNDTSDVLSIDDDDLEETIAFVHKGGMTFLSPILPDLRGIVCTAGSRESHLAILSRESDVPCVLAAELTDEVADEVADGDTVVLDLTGLPARARADQRHPPARHPGRAGQKGAADREQAQLHQPGRDAAALPDRP
jgi:phosphohistidine swiveling domain-containing protein